MTSTPQVVVSASIAFDHIMSFNGSFRDHLLIEKTDVLAVSFLVESHKRIRGGVAGNISYSLGLLGVPSYLVGAVGGEFGPYAQALAELGVDLSAVKVIPEDFTSTAFMNSDLQGNTIASFYPGAGGRSAEIDVKDLAATVQYGIVSAGAPDAMVKHAEEIAASGAKLIFDPAFQIVIFTPDQINRGIEIADTVMGNEYEFEMIEEKTGLTIEDIARKVPLTIRTLAERGAELRAGGEIVRVPPAPPTQFVDPTGGGDAFRSGTIAGLLLGKDLDVVGRMGALAATYAIEHQGPQEHSYTPSSFRERFVEAYPDYAGALTVEELEAVRSGASLVR